MGYCWLAFGRSRQLVVPSCSFSMAWPHLLVIVVWLRAKTDAIKSVQEALALVRRYSPGAARGVDGHLLSAYQLANL